MSDLGKNTAKNGKGEEEPVESYNPTERSVSRASRSSFDVYQKRILGISNFSKPVFWSREYLKSQI